jgi:hypothetical protein
MPQGSKSACSWRKTSAWRRPKTEASPCPLECASAGQHHRGSACLPPHSTSHRVLRSTRGAAPAPRHASALPPRARGAGAAPRPASPVGGQGAFFEYFPDHGRAHVQHPRGIAHAARMHGPSDARWLDRGRWACVALLQEQRPPTPEATCPAAVPLRAFRGRAMAHTIRPVAVGTMQHLRNPGPPIQSWWLSSSNMRIPDQQL